MASENLALIWGFEGVENFLSLVDWCTLSVTRKDWQGQIRSVYGGERAQKLVQAVVECLPPLQQQLVDNELTSDEMTPGKLLLQLWTVVSFMKAKQHWVRAVAATPGLIGDYNRLITVADTPSHVAKHFVQHMGVHISYQQLITAAHNRHGGVEVWVQVQHERGLQTDIPDIAVAVCCSRSSEIRGMLENWAQTAEMKDIQDILQLAMNSSNHSTAHDTAAALMPLCEDTAVLQQLLHTAVLRGHRWALHCAVQLPAVQQLSPAAVLQLIQCRADGSMSMLGPTQAARMGSTLLRQLVRLPAAALLIAEQLVPLLETAAAKSERSGDISILCSLPAAQLVTAAQCASILEQLILNASKSKPWNKRYRDSAQASAVPAVCTLPAAQQLDVDAWLRIATAAVDKLSDAELQTLCGLPAAQQAGIANVGQLRSIAAVTL